MLTLKHAAFLILWIPATASAQDSFFFAIDDESAPPAISIKDDLLIASVKIHKVPAPKSSSIVAFHMGYGPGRDYKIQVNLKDVPADDWHPMIKLGEDVIADGIGVARPVDERFPSSFSIESGDPDKVRAWVSALSELCELGPDKVSVELTPEPSESDGKDDANKPSDTKADKR